MAISAGLKTDVENIIVDLVADLTPRQNSFFAINGKYWEGALTHDILPADGVGKVPDKTKKKSDFVPWNKFGGGSGVDLPSLMKCCTCVNAYDGPLGKGWCVFGFVKEGNDKHRRCENIGPDTRRTFDWIEYNEPTG